VAAGGIVALDAVGFDAMEISHRPDETETVTCARPASSWFGAAGHGFRYGLTVVFAFALVSVVAT